MNNLSQDKARARLVTDGLDTLGEAMRFLGIGRTALYGLMDSGQLAYVKIGRSRRVPHRALVELAAANLKGGDVE